MPMVKASFRRAMRRWVGGRRCPSCRSTSVDVDFAHARRPPVVSCGACGWSGAPDQTRAQRWAEGREMPVMGRKDDDE